LTFLPNIFNSPTDRPEGPIRWRNMYKQTATLLVMGCTLGLGPKRWTK